MAQPIILIPARMDARRLPGKPLADINGKPMIVHVWERAIAADVGPVLVAAGDPAIAAAITDAGGEAMLTRSDHVSGSDRIYEAIERYDPARHFDIIINLQGDLPVIAPQSIKAALAPLAESAADIATLAAEIRDAADGADPNVVKLAGPMLASGHMRALSFSRAPVPWGAGPHYQHIGIYAYRRAALDRFVGLEPSPLEMRERLEQLRAIEAGMRIDAALVDECPIGVDTEDQLERVRNMLRPK
ncbi:3-deoxy-manno-octulosonate cytidylyltransferase [Methyloferula stellata]|uniref:3-deoxy-manno-octulosonate cytidylyltransferase n=1 Tax=Methyloferula stellata TaxID=876270 RepID=UPI00036E8204|nr:3-deoxy-manno-octulosonate cytidylyltransferase [Methyloferula stellata]